VVSGAQVFLVVPVKILEPFRPQHPHCRMFFHWIPATPTPTASTGPWLRSTVADVRFVRSCIAFDACCLSWPVDSNLQLGLHGVAFAATLLVGPVL